MHTRNLIIYACIIIFLYRFSNAEHSFDHRKIRNKYPNNVFEYTNGNYSRKKKAVLSKDKINFLNMQQRVVLHQFLAFYVLDDKFLKNGLCKNHSTNLRDSVNDFKPWALKMLDASSKLQSGILNGNLMEYGSFKQCINVYNHNEGDPIHGKFCSLKITPSMQVVEKILEFRNISAKRFGKLRRIVQGASLVWNTCVPDSCRPTDVLEHFQKRILPLIEGLGVKITIADNDCFSLNDEEPLSTNSWIVSISFTSLIILIMICTAFDMVIRKRNDHQHKIISIFSMNKNLNYVFSNGKDAGQLGCLDGLRSLSIVYVVIGHRFIMTLFYPTVNSLELTEWLLKYSSTIILGGTVCVDTFFLLSGLLVSYHLLEHFTRGNKFNIFTFFLYRYLRITPSYAVIILTYCVLIQYFGSGPLWQKSVENIQRSCQDYWWAALLYVQNYTNPKNLCVLQTWYLTCDMQFYIFSPLLIYPLWKWQKLGYLVLTLAYVISVTVAFCLSWSYKFEANLLVSNHFLESDYFTLFYITPYSRASPYIIGVGLGYALFSNKKKKLKMPLWFVIVGWFFSIGVITAVLLYNHLFQLENYEYNRFEVSLYLSFSRSAWVLGVAWIIWACNCGYGGPIDFFLSLYIFKVFGKLAYSIFLIHMLFQYLTIGALKLPIYFSNYYMVREFLADFCLTTVCAILFTLVVESPLLKIAKILTQKS